MQCTRKKDTSLNNYMHARLLLLYLGVVQKRTQTLFIKNCSQVSAFMTDAPLNVYGR
jgi:hypothetical protein